MTIASEIRKLAPDKLVELFILDTAPIGGNTLDYFHSGTTQVNAPVVFQGQTYTPWALEAEGFEKNGQGALPQPVLTMGNAGGLISRTAVQLKDLVGAKVLRKRTFAKYLDAVNFPTNYGALHLNGATRVDLPDAQALRIALGDWTLEARVMFNAAPAGAQAMLFGADTGGVALGWSIGGGLRATLMGGTSVTASFTPVVGTEYHIAAVYSLSTKIISFYINGTLVRAVGWVYQGVAESATRYLGGAPTLPTSANVRMRDIRIYNKTLSALQVSSANSAGSMFGPVAAYDASEAAGTVLHDSINGLDGVLDDGATFGPWGYSNPDADPTAEYPIDVFYVIQKSKEVPAALQFTLGSAMDIQGIKIPLRPLLQNSCPWKYRGAECGWTGGYYDKHDNPSTPQLDECGKRVSSCKVRFGAAAELPFGGFPGAKRYS